MESIMSFGDTLKDLRERLAVTQAALAETSGVPLGTVRDYEQGRREPLLSTAQKLAKALGVSLDQFPAIDPAAPSKRRKDTGRRPRR
jgi:transcriptional regulator with XRE-family HTH domain